MSANNISNESECVIPFEKLTKAQLQRYLIVNGLTVPEVYEDCLKAVEEHFMTYSVNKKTVTEQLEVMKKGEGMKAFFKK